MVQFAWGLFDLPALKKKYLGRKKSKKIKKVLSQVRRKSVAHKDSEKIINQVQKISNFTLLHFCLIWKLLDQENEKQMQDDQDMNENVVLVHKKALDNRQVLTSDEEVFLHIV